MKLGAFYGVGIGPGDPSLITIKGAEVIAQCKYVFCPKSSRGSESVALAIAGKYVKSDASVSEIVFPMTRDKSELMRHWQGAANQVMDVLKMGHDACFLTLGDPFVFSTYIYLVRALKEINPQVETHTIPGITSFCAAASIAGKPIGEGKQVVTIVPTDDDLTTVKKALENGGTVVLMKIAGRLEKIIELLEMKKALDRSILVSRAGMANEKMITDLSTLKGSSSKLGYLSIIIVNAREERP